jgi:hypothetical protein
MKQNHIRRESRDPRSVHEEKVNDTCATVASLSLSAHTHSETETSKNTNGGEIKLKGHATKAKKIRRGKGVQTCAHKENFAKKKKQCEENWPVFLLPSFSTKDETCCVE